MLKTIDILTYISAISEWSSAIFTRAGQNVPSVCMIAIFMQKITGYPIIPNPSRQTISSRSWVFSLPWLIFLSLKDQKAKVREELRSRHSEDRRASIGDVTRKEERHSLNKVDTLAEESRYVAVFP